MRCNFFGVERSARAASAACRALILLVIALVVGIHQKIYHSGADFAPEAIFRSRALERADFSGNCWNEAAVATRCLWEIAGSRTLRLLGAEIAPETALRCWTRERTDTSQRNGWEDAAVAARCLLETTGPGSSYPTSQARKLRQG